MRQVQVRRKPVRTVTRRYAHALDLRSPSGRPLPY